MELTVHYDFASPFCFIATEIVGRLVRGGDLVVDWQPFEVIDYLPPRGAMPQNPAFVRRGEAQRAEKLADAYGLTLHIQERLLNSNNALCAIEFAKEQSRNDVAPDLPFTVLRRLFESYYADQRDISEIGTIVEVCAGHLAAEPLSAALKSGRYRSQVAESKARAHELGVVAVPTWLSRGYGVVGIPAFEALENLLHISSSTKITEPSPV